MTTAERPVRVPFPVVDEVARHCLQEEEPETVHIEIHLPGRLDPHRLRKAFMEALHRHPRILMREAPGGWYRRRYEWELTAEPDVEVVSFPPPGPNALRDARTRALVEAPPLSLSPPIRLEVVEGCTGPVEGSEATDAVGEVLARSALAPDDSQPAGDGTVLFLTINHTALDGPACLRVLATAAELYSGRDNSPAAPPTRTPDRAQPLDGTPSNWSPPARVAHGTPEPSPGNGLLVAELPLPHRPKGSPYTVNDQLMVTTALMIAHWNREHGARPRPLRITMPVDDRPRDTTMPIGNGTRLVEVTFTPDELSHACDDMPSLLQRTATRTRALKSQPRPQLGHGAALLTAPVTPVAWRAALTRGLRRAAAPWTSTTLLSNIGRIPYALDFGEEAGRAHAVWFSAPARMPRGLTVTTASTAGRLHLALRWSRALLSHGDGAHLRDLFEHCLHTTEATP
ncbi:condensation protein [Streptomyces luteolifulvus]|uniref:Condensation protein n=1 Tax=Streptomyces luteolifulvus TaxID=2615112 RepID=A0A6H9V2X3_9ACTN|nr:condensation protein [Streptomyces luteolifulvus]KAB1148802.1 condensation protein [Streptomyces luteolifulvus]